MSSPTIQIGTQRYRTDEAGVPYVNAAALNAASLDAAGQFSHPVQVDVGNNVVMFHDVTSGKLVKLDLGVGDVHVDRPLAAYATGFSLEQKDLVADAVSPIVPVPKPSDSFWQWDKDDVFQLVKPTVSAAGSNIGEVTPRQSTRPFATLQYALRTFLPTEVEAASDEALRIGMRYLALPLEKLLLSREYRVATQVMTAANYPTYITTLTAAQAWNGGASSNPIENIHRRMEAALKPINRIVMSERTYNVFSTNAQVQKFIASKTNVPPKPNAQNANELSAILQLPPIVIGTQKYKNSATTYDYVWGNNVALYHLPSTMPPMGRAISYNTFRWMGGLAEGVNSREAAMFGSVSMDSGWGVRTYYDPTRGAQGGKGCVVWHQDDEFFVEEAVSGLIVGAYQP